jgi:hypothetical protein
MPDSALPPSLQGKLHWDWPWPFSKIPRGWTAFKWGKPKLLAGNQLTERAGAPAPIGEPESWQVSRYPDAPGILKYLPLYAAVTLPNGRHFRVGARYDDVDDYVQFPTVASRVYTGPNQDTSTK